MKQPKYLDSKKTTRNLQESFSHDSDGNNVQVYFYAFNSVASSISKTLRWLNPRDPGSFVGEIASWQGVVNALAQALEKSEFALSIAKEAWVKPYRKKTPQAKIIVLLLSAKDLVARQGALKVEKRLTQIMRYFRRTCFSIFGKETLSDHTFDYQPMIAIGLEDLMSLYSEDEKPSDFHRELNLDHRIKYLDSSIWNRYVPVSSDQESSKSFSDRFMEIAEQMVQWHHDGIYDTVAAVTTLEFQTRMLHNSFIARVSEKGHNELVRPFKYHSETQMRRNANRIMDFFDEDRNGITLKAVLKWNFLLVDDQAENVPMSTIKKEASPSLTKMALIQKILHADFSPDSIFLKSPKGENCIVEEMIDELRPQKTIVFDVILLDYLLGSGKEREREYGHDFLLKLRKEPALQKGPYNRFWIFPISSFPHAFTDKLHQLGINHLTDWWHLSNGGDPVCAPELFRYNLLEFLQQQVKVCFYNEELLANLVRKFQGIINFNEWVHTTSRLVKHLQAYRDQLSMRMTSAFSRSLFEYISHQDTHELEEATLSLLETLDSWGTNKSMIREIKTFEKKYSLLSSAFPADLQKKLKNRENFKVYILCADHAEDKEYLEKLIKHLSQLKRANTQIRHRYTIQAGDNIPDRIEDDIKNADLFLLLISVDLFEEKIQQELDMVFDQKRKRKKTIIPINCRNCDVHDERINKLKALPDNGVFLKDSPGYIDREMTKITQAIVGEISRPISKSKK